MERAVAGILMTTQCQMPAPPVTASGSCTIMAKLLVPSGGFVQLSAGEIFCPWQPRPLKVNFSGKGWSGLTSGLVSSKACVPPLNATRKMAIAAKYFPRCTEITRDMDLRFDLILTLSRYGRPRSRLQTNVRNSEYNFD